MSLSKNGAANKSKLVENGRELSARYKVWLCDIWGVVHNGEASHPAAREVLIKHRENGGIVILITNAPRPTPSIVQQLEGLNVPAECYDSIVASGDVTRELVTAYKGRKVFFLGPDRDHVLKEGLPVEWAGIEEADAVLCSGLYNDQTEQPEEYDDMLAQFKARDLPLICANPDLIVQFGDRLIPCAGAIAARYSAIGGKVEMAGKPFAPIYEVALARAAQVANNQVANNQVAGIKVDRETVVALGDGMKTDITGARDNDLAVMFITGGIHDADIGSDGSVEDMANIARDAVKGVNIAGAMRNLEW